MKFDRWIVPHLVILFLAGCGSSNSDFVAVTGNVSYRGEPVEGATIAFRGEGSAAPAIGVTDAKGEFSLATGTNPGAKTGEHIVTVTKYVLEGGQQEEHVSMEEAGRTKLDATSRSEIPPRYASPSETELRCTVKPTGANHFALRLAD